MTNIAVVILNYNGEKLLSQFLPSVLEFSSACDIYVADNCSSDNSLPLLKKDFPTVRIIRLLANYGFCKGYNEALKQIEAEIVILLNSDVEVTEGWTTPIHNLFKSDPHVAAVQPKILSFRDRTKFEYAGAGGGMIDALGYPFCRGRIFEHIEEDQGQYDDTREIFWASGACMAIRLQVFKEMGGFDEDFFAHMEEIDLCWKMHRSGQKVVYCGKSTVYHLGAGTLGYTHPGKTFLNFRNSLIVLLKQLDTGELMVKMPVRFALDLLAAMVFLFKGKPEHSWAVLKAQADFLTTLKRNIRKRKENRKVYPGYSKRLIYPGSVLFDYYVKGKKKYGQ